MHAAFLHPWHKNSSKFLRCTGKVENHQAKAWKNEFTFLHRNAKKMGSRIWGAVGRGVRSEEQEDILSHVLRTTESPLANERSQ